jgi:hypothetical protein
MKGVIKEIYMIQDQLTICTRIGYPTWKAWYRGDVPDKRKLSSDDLGRPLTGMRRHDVVDDPSRLQTHDGDRSDRDIL